MPVNIPTFTALPYRAGFHLNAHAINTIAKHTKKTTSTHNKLSPISILFTFIPPPSIPDSGRLRPSLYPFLFTGEQDSIPAMVTACYVSKSSYHLNLTSSIASTFHMVYAVIPSLTFKHTLP
jgi:hypothetical protein